MRAWSLTLPTTPYFLQTSRSPSHSSTNSTMNTMPHHLDLPRTLVMFTQNLSAPQILQHAMRQSVLMPLINWKSISRSSARISRNVICLGGGGANVRIGLTCTILCVIFFVFQVRSTSSYYHSSIYTFLGSAVAVERIFSGGRDTISIHHASLQPETIRTLMVLKHQLHRTHEDNIIVLE